MSISYRKNAVGKVENILNRSNIIEIYIDDNDRTPNWDGNIFKENNYTDLKPLVALLEQWWMIMGWNI